MQDASVEAQRDGDSRLRVWPTDVEGRFAFEFAHPGRWTLTVDHAREEACGFALKSRRETFEVDVDSRGVESLEVRFRPRPSPWRLALANLRIVDAEDGTPIGRVNCTWTGLDVAWSTDDERRRTLDGRLSSVLPEGEYRLTIASIGYESFTSTIHLSADRGEQEIRLHRK